MISNPQAISELHQEPFGIKIVLFCEFDDNKDYCISCFEAEFQLIHDTRKVEALEQLEHILNLPSANCI